MSMDVKRRLTARHPGVVLVLAILGCATPACTALTARSAAPVTPGLVDVETIRSLDGPSITRQDWIARLGAPDYVSEDNLFIAYQRGAPFRNVWRGSGQGNPGVVPTGSDRDIVWFYQLIGVWLTSDDRVRKTRHFMAPCGACVRGQSLLPESEIDAWRQSADGAFAIPGAAR